MLGSFLACCEYGNEGRTRNGVHDVYLAGLYPMYKITGCYRDPCLQSLLAASKFRHDLCVIYDARA